VVVAVAVAVAEVGAAETSGLLSCFCPEELRAVRLVMVLRRRRISSTSCMPSGFFLKRYWSKCRPSDEEVNG
jgi:hypothetical protein